MLPNNLEYVSGRTSRAGDLYYKGVGCPYNRHATLTPKPSDQKLGPSSVFYYGYDVKNPNWVGKTGVFLQRYQPYFSDLIGACGPKESAIIKNSTEFKLSAVKVVDCVEYLPEHNQRCFVLNYKDGRKQFLNEGSPKALVELLSYMITTDWNFPWDKSSIKDVAPNGNVTDVADMFRSDKLIHKIGTVYSILFSLHQLDTRKFISFSKLCNAPYCGISGIPFLAIQILKGIGVNIESVFKDGVETDADFYIHFIGNLLLRGRNCSSVEDESFNEDVSPKYIDRFITSIPKNKQYLIEQGE
jgi:hypothetical protein